MSDYFSSDYVSNSGLSRLGQELSGSDAFNYSQAQKMGTLIHALLLEPEKVDLIQNKVVEYSYTPEEMKQGRMLSIYTKNSALCRSLIQNCEKEVELYADDVPFEYNGFQFTLNCRCKYDFHHINSSLGGDFKTTTAPNMQQFLIEIERFQYHRARVFYAKISGAKKDVIIGINKKCKGIFPVFLNEGDELWRKGEGLMNELAFRYYMLKE